MFFPKHACSIRFYHCHLWPSCTFRLCRSKGSLATSDRNCSLEASWMQGLLQLMRVLNILELEGSVFLQCLASLWASSTTAGPALKLGPRFPRFPRLGHPLPRFQMVSTVSTRTCKPEEVRSTLALALPHVGASGCSSKNLRKLRS